METTRGRTTAMCVVRGAVYNKREEEPSGEQRGAAPSPAPTKEKGRGRN